MRCGHAGSNEQHCKVEPAKCTPFSWLSGSRVLDGVLLAGGCDDPDEWEPLQKPLKVLSIPRLGFETSTSNLRAVTQSHPSFRIWATGAKGFHTGDIVFASARGDNCGSVPLANRCVDKAL